MLKNDLYTQEQIDDAERYLPRGEGEVVAAQMIGLNNQQLSLEGEKDKTKEMEEALLYSLEELATRYIELAIKNRSREIR